MEKTKLSTQPYKGTTDAYPEDIAVRNYIFDTWSRVAKSFGYQEYDTPMIEEASMYRAKSGDEIANTQLYNFFDKGNREIALRPEMTPSLARIVAAKRNELTTPIRFFNIGKFFRYEKPQRGRRREFFQLNMDILGVESVNAELEQIQYITAVMKEFGAKEETFEIRVNSRLLLNYIFQDVLQLDQETTPSVARAIDNFLKMGKDSFVEYIKDIGLNDEQIKKLLNFLDWDLTDLEKIKEESQGAKDILTLFNNAQELKLDNIKFSPYVMRGFLYYTGIVIETYDIGSSDNPRALCGGGRYDDLLSIFGEEKLPAFGFGWGDVIMEDFLRTYNLLPDFNLSSNIYITLMNQSLFIETSKIAQEFRDAGLTVECELESGKLKKQLKYANKKGFRWVVILGEDELEKGIILLKDMNKNLEYSFSVSDSIELIRESK